MEGKIFLLRSTGILAIILSAVSFVYGILYIIMGEKAPLVGLFGAIIVVALLVNVLLAFLNQAWGAADRVQRLGTFYLVFSMAAIIAMVVGGFTASSVYEHRTAYLWLYAVVYPAFLGTLGIGLLHALFTAAHAVNIPGKKSNIPVILTKGKKVLLIILFFLKLTGLFFAYVLLSDYFGMIQILVSQNSLFMVFFYLALTVCILKLCGDRATPRRTAGAAGLVLAAVFMLPLLLTPRAETGAEESFAAAFGEAWREEIDPEREEYFRPRIFSIPAYFLGIPPGDYQYERDVLFYRGKEGPDEGIELYFDVYMPPEKGEELPGSGSTVIRIHGGALIAGDKGAHNMMQMNKYLASLGYTVFDIQYGLTNILTYTDLLEMYEFFGFLNHTPLGGIINDIAAAAAPDHLTGSFNLDDIMRHLGIFTRYLEENAGRYGAEIDSVFISGASTGGHLSTAMALAIAGGEYKDIFGAEIEVKGYIPFYPANRAEYIHAAGGAKEWLNVEMLVCEESPPCLIYQGTKDGMVLMETAAFFYESYLEAGNKKCVVIYMPLAAHGSDEQFNGNYNQIFLYYMERFMELVK